MPYAWRPWTRKDELRLLSMVAGGVRYPAIARVLGRPLNSVQAKGRRLGLRLAAAPKSYDTAVACHARKGWCDWEIALKLGVSRSLVQKIRSRLGIRRA